MGSRSASPDDDVPSAPLRDSVPFAPLRDSVPSAPRQGERPAAETEENILVGHVICPHGLRGEVKIEILSDVADRFAPGRELLLALAGRPPRKVRVESFRPLRGGGVIRLAGVGDRDSAADLRGARLEVAASQVPDAPEGMYYHFELVGCRCVDREHGDLGEVEAVVEDGGGVLLEVSDGKRTLPVPFVEAFLEDVDVDGRKIRLHLPPGLIESCASRS